MSLIESLPITVLGHIFNMLEWTHFKKLPLVCKKFLRSIEANWKRRFLSEFGKERGKHVMLERWKEETLILHKMIEDSQSGRRFDLMGIWADPEGEDIFTLHMVIERIEDAKNVTSKQRKQKKPLVGRILWTLLTTGEDLWLSWKTGESGSEIMVGEYDVKERKLLLEGVELDEMGEGLLATDLYEIIISEDGFSFEGKTRGNEGLWDNKIGGGMAYLLPNFVEDYKKKHYPNIGKSVQRKFTSEFTVFFQNHHPYKRVTNICPCFTQNLEAVELFSNTITHPNCEHIYYCSPPHLNLFKESHDAVSKQINLIEEDPLKSLKIVESLDKDQSGFPRLVFFHALLNKFELSDKPVELAQLLNACCDYYLKEKMHQYNIVLSCLHLISHAHFLIKDMSPDDEESKKSFYSLKESIIRKVIIITRFTNYHTLVVSSYYKELYDMYCGDYLSCISSDDIPAFVQKLLPFIKEMVAHMAFTSQPKHCKKMLEESVLVAEKLNIPEWSQYSKLMVAACDKLAKFEFTSLQDASEKLEKLEKELKQNKNCIIF